MFDLDAFDGYPRTKKLWGEERLLINADYCAKLLIIEPGFACSLHRHDRKDEQFTVLEGRVMIEHGTDPSYLFTERKDVGDSLRMTPGTFHRFWSAQPSRAILLEVSSHHEDSDVERLQESAQLTLDDIQALYVTLGTNTGA